MEMHGSDDFRWPGLSMSLTLSEAVRVQFRALSSPL